MAQDQAPPPEELLAKAGVLAEALPYMRQFAGRRFVIKYGGHAMETPNWRVPSHAISCC